MKRVLFLLAVAVTAATASAQGVVFEQIPFADGIKKAADQGKYLFVDCYTSWCGPCKNMTEKIFPQKMMGDYFNPQFVSVKFDIEKEADGQRLAKEFGITAIPTFLVFKPDGTLLHKIVGGASQADAFLVKVDESFDDEKAYGSLKKIYEDGRRDKEFLLPLIEVFSSVGDPKVQEAVGELLASSTPRQKVSPDYWFIFSTPRLSPKGSQAEQFLFDNQEKFRRAMGREDVDKELVPRYRNLLKDVVEGRLTMEPARFAAMQKQIAGAGFDPADNVHAFARMADACVNGDMERRIAVAAKESPQLGMWTYLIMYDNAGMAGLTPEQRAGWIAIGPAVEASLPESERALFNTSLTACTARHERMKQSKE